MTCDTAALLVLCILDSRKLSGRCGMKRNDYGRTDNEQLSDRVEDEVESDSDEEIALQKISADYYERSWRNRINERQGDLWIALGLYLILAGIAFVVL